MSLAGGPQRAWVYRTHPLDTRSERIERALIMVHGQGRNADGYFRSAIAGRSATFLLGELDILPLYGFDSSCAAMAQGPTRFARGLAYARYLNDNFGAQHQTVIVRACGHSARCMFTAEAALPILFPKE